MLTYREALSDTLGGSYSKDGSLQALVVPACKRFRVCGPLWRTEMRYKSQLKSKKRVMPQNGISDLLPVMLWFPEPAPGAE